MSYRKLITRNELPNVRGLTRVVSQKQDAIISSVNSAEIVINTIIIPAGTWNIDEGFILDFSGFYQGTPLTTSQFRIRVVGNGGAGPPNIIVAEFNDNPGVNRSNVVRGNVMLGRSGQDTIRNTYQIVPGAGLPIAISANETSGFASSFAQNITIQMNVAINATSPIIEYSQYVFYKLPKPN